MATFGGEFFYFQKDFEKDPLMQALTFPVPGERVSQLIPDMT